VGAGGLIGAAAIGALVVPATGAAAAPAGTGKATVNVVHGVPGLAVKICVDGAKVVDNFRYGSTIVGAGLPAGRHTVKVLAAGKACAAPAVLKQTYDLAARTNYTLVANLNAAGKPNLKAFGNDVSKTRHGNARLTVRHTAQAAAVNVWANGTKLISGRSFTSGASATLGVPAGTYHAKVTLPNSGKPVIGPATVRLHAGNAYQVYAVGSPGHYRLVSIGVPVGMR
jgi:hypothetical protein